MASIVIALHGGFGDGSVNDEGDCADDVVSAGHGGRSQGESLSRPNERQDAGENVAELAPAP
jgi:hypothetical protein